MSLAILLSAKMAIRFKHAATLIWVLFMMAHAVAQHGTVTGLVKDRNNSTVSDIVLAAYRVNVERGAMSAVMECRTPTDDNGRFRCSDLPAGKYLIAAAPQALWSPRYSDFCQGYSQTFYPGVAGLDEALMIDLSAYGAVEANLTIRKAVPVPTSINLAEASSQDKVDLLLHGTHFDLPLISISADLGERKSGKVCGLGKAQYVLVDSWNQSGITVTSRITFNPTTQTSIRVDGSDSVLVHGFILNSKLIEPHLTEIRFYPIDRPAQEMYSALIGPEGRFTAPLENGRYYVQLGSGTPAIASVTLADHRTAGSFLDLSGKSGSLSLLIAPGTQGGTVEVAACEADRAFQKAGFTLIDVDTHEVRMSSIVDGRSFFHGVTPGTYLLAGWQDLWQTAYRDESVLLGNNAAGSRTVVVADNSELHVPCSELNAFKVSD